MVAIKYKDTLYKIAEPAPSPSISVKRLVEIIRDGILVLNTPRQGMKKYDIAVKDVVDRARNIANAIYAEMS